MSRPAVTPRVDLTRPSGPRVHNYLTGGHSWFPADREHAEQLIRSAPPGSPDVRELAQASRRFILAATTWAASRGIRQFLDCGAGLPGGPAVHEAAREARPGSVVAYVDLDAVVMKKLRAHYRDSEGIAVAEADVRDPQAVLGCREVKELLDLSRPVALLFGGTLSAMTAGQARRAVAGFTKAVAPGSAVAVSCASWRDRDAGERMAAALSAGGTWHNHSEADVRAFFGRLEVMGGVSDLRHWPALVPAGAAGVIGGVAVKEECRSRKLLP